MELSNAINTIKNVFEDMDKGYTIWEYREEIKKLLEAGIFVRHIEKHLEKITELKNQKVICKICEKTIDDIDKEEGVFCGEKINKETMKELDIFIEGCNKIKSLR